jgi:hypothetical protein
VVVVRNDRTAKVAVLVETRDLSFQAVTARTPPVRLNGKEPADRAKSRGASLLLKLIEKPRVRLGKLTLRQNPCHARSAA